MWTIMYSSCINKKLFLAKQTIINLHVLDVHILPSYLHVEKNENKNTYKNNKMNIKEEN